MTDDAGAAEQEGDPTAEGADASATGADDAYGGILGAFPYAASASDSYLFKSYVLAGGLLALAVSAVFAFSLVGLIATTTGVTGGTFTFSRAFIVLIALLVVAPLVAPVLFAARRHRRSGGDSRFDATMAAMGYAFVLSLYVALLVSAPAELRDSTTGALAPLIDFLYSLPPLAGLVPPLVVALSMWLVVRNWE